MYHSISCLRKYVHFYFEQYCLQVQCIFINLSSQRFFCHNIVSCPVCHHYLHHDTVIVAKW